ncbi:hypothetical protein [Halorubrum sp. SP3]|uniref:hypothetical protein n=1 Tax=Halorubrum sp. SP3 TaxID=1537265 RepID=UPI0013050865|nr:hypothetical protein [Halorubrum sp. SP3]
MRERSSAAHLIPPNADRAAVRRSVTRFGGSGFRPGSAAETVIRSADDDPIC